MVVISSSHGMKKCTNTLLSRVRYLFSKLQEMKVKVRSFWCSISTVVIIKSKETKWFHQCCCRPLLLRSFVFN